MSKRRLGINDWILFSREEPQDNQAIWVVDVFGNMHLGCKIGSIIVAAGLRYDSHDNDIAIATGATIKHCVAWRLFDNINIPTAPKIIMSIGAE